MQEATIMIRKALVLEVENKCKKWKFLKICEGVPKRPFTACGAYYGLWRASWWHNW